MWQVPIKSHRINRFICAKEPLLRQDPEIPAADDEVVATAFAIEPVVDCGLLSVQK